MRHDICQTNGQLSPSKQEGRRLESRRPPHETLSAFTCTFKTQIQEIVPADGVFELNALYLNYFNIDLT